MKKEQTFPGKTYSVHTASGCTVSDKNGWSKTIDAPDGYFTAHAGEVTIDGDDAATLREVFNAAPIAGGGGGVSATGEKVVPLEDYSLTVKHATWFTNDTQSSVLVLPAEWKNAVATCYLKTAVPVSLSGVTWLYGEPAMMEGFSFVIALQQVDASTVLANLAYSLKQ